MPDDFNHDFGRDFAGGLISADFGNDFNHDFAGGYTPPIIPPPPPAVEYPSEYVAVPPMFAIQVPAEYRTIRIEPESLT